MTATEGAVASRLREALGARLLRRGAPGYEEARPVWNGMVNRYPELIAQCATTEEVASVVRFAAEAALPLAVRGGGHNVAGLGTCEGGVVADLSLMRRVDVFPERLVAVAQGGCTWAEVDAGTTAHGFATTGGLISTTGIGGLTLGGGIGWLMRSGGLTCDNLLSAEVVTADGQVTRASERENPELLWGLRGGGGNFGAVTSFEYHLRPVPPEILGGVVLYPLDQGADIVGFWAEWAPSAPEELTTMVAFVAAPPLPFVPEQYHFTPVTAVLACYAGRPEEGEALVRPLRDLGGRLAEHVGPMPYTVLQSMLDEGAPRGLRNYWKPAYFASPREMAAARDALVEAAASRPSPLSQVHLHHMGGAVARRDVAHSAFGSRDAEFALNIIGMWQDAADDEANVSWARERFSAVEPFTRGAYVNFLSDTGSADARSAYPPATYARLAELKRRYDPSNLFHINHNIIPAG
jgi:FAD/FMN-containing dehydrogenase